MHPSGDDHIAHLLRMKRYERPPPDYFENFLHEFRRRRYDEFLRQPHWRICFERARDFVFWHNLRSLAYTCAAVVAVVAGTAVLSIRLSQQPDTTQLAVQESPIPGIPFNTENELDFPPLVFSPTFDMLPTLRPRSRDIPVVSVLDEFVPLNLEWEFTRSRISHRYPARPH